MRGSEGKSRISFFSEKDADLIKQLAIISEQTGISVQVLLENRTASGGLKTNKDMMQEAAGKMGVADNFISYLTGNLISSDARQQAIETRKTWTYPT